MVKRLIEKIDSTCMPMPAIVIRKVARPSATRKALTLWKPSPW